MVIIVSLRSNLERVILGLYEYYLKTNIKVYSIEILHNVLQRIITAHLNTIANYIKQLELLDYIERKNHTFILTDKLLIDGEILYIKKIPNIKPKEEQSILDKDGFIKY